MCVRGGGSGTINLKMYRDEVVPHCWQSTIHLKWALQSMVQGGDDP